MNCTATPQLPSTVLEAEWEGLYARWFAAVQAKLQVRSLRFECNNSDVDEYNIGDVERKKSLFRRHLPGGWNDHAQQ